MRATWTWSRRRKKIRRSDATTSTQPRLSWRFSTAPSSLPIESGHPSIEKGIEYCNLICSNATFMDIILYDFILVSLSSSTRARTRSCVPSRILTLPEEYRQKICDLGERTNTRTFHRLTSRQIRVVHSTYPLLRLEAVYACERQRPEPSLTARRVRSPHGPREQPVPAGRTRCMPIRAISAGRPSAFGVCLTHACKLEFYVLMRESRRWRHEVQRE